MRIRFNIAILLGMALLMPPQALAQTSVKPLVMLLLDTSGSMEYEAGLGANAGQEFSVPICEPQGTSKPQMFPPGSYVRSRLATAKEVLTGTIKGYWCRYDLRLSDPGAEDYNYPIPHVVACSQDGTCGFPKQNNNGLLDIRRDDFKFAFMSFDSLESSDDGPKGMYSYGDTKVGGLNLGARNEVWGQPNIPNEWNSKTQSWSYSDANRASNNRGQLIGPPAEESYGALRKQNRLVQYEVLSTVGYWGTPLAPLLSDARTFLQTHPNTIAYQPGTGKGDPYHNCRDRVAILITDGRASQGEGVGGYSTTVSAVYALKNTPPTPVAVYVVGFNLASVDTSVITELDPASGGPADGVYIVDSPAELAVALSEIFNTVLSDTQSRTEVTYTNATRSSTDRQYQFNAAYGPDHDNPLNQVGYLDQSIYRCSDDCADTTNGSQSCVEDILLLGERLKEKASSNRKIYTPISGNLKSLDSGLVNLASGPADMATYWNVPQSGTLPKVNPSGFDGEKPLPPKGSIGSAKSFGNQLKYMNELIRFLRSDDWTMRHKEPLGAIVHSTPVVQEPASEGRYPLASYNTYVNTIGSSGYAPACRPTVLYTGTHDGQIHAFRVDGLEKPSGTCAKQVVPVQQADEVGQELWSIIPQHLVKRSHALVTTSMTLMDGRPYVGDVLLSRNDPLQTKPAKEAAQWRSVLTTGYGGGGRGFIAIDVTQALDISTVDVLWEIDNTSRCRNGHCFAAVDGFANDFSKLGLTSPQPTYGTAFVDGTEVAIAILAGGDAPDEGEAYAGRVVYVVRLDTGEKIAEFSDPMGNVKHIDGGPASIDYPITGSPAAYPNMPGAVTTRVFIGDAGGRMWRINMGVADPDSWTMELFHDAYDGAGPIPAQKPDTRQPVMGAPRLALDGPYGHVALVYGTGSIDYLATTASSRSVVYSVSEVTALNGLITAKVNWHKVFSAQEKLTGEPEVYAKAAYFTSFVENANDACQAGAGRVYGVHYVNQGKSTDGGNDTTEAALDADGDLTTTDKVKYVSTGDEVPFGARIIERPTCMPGGLGGSAAGAQPGQRELVVNVAKGGSQTGNKSVPKGVNAGKVGTKTLTHPISSGGDTLQSAAWGYVLY